MAERSCPSCGTRNETGAVTCAACGTTLDPAALGAEGAPSSPFDDQLPPARRSMTARAVAALLILGLVATGVAALLRIGDPPTSRLPAVVATLDSDIVGAAGCTSVESHPDELEPGVPHAQPPETVAYRSDPPTSGNHYGLAAITGVFDEPRPPEVWMHNLEHGHVGVLYSASLDPQIRAALGTLTRRHDTLMFMHPVANLPQVLDVVSWTRVMRCGAPTQPEAVVAAVEAYFETYVGHAPEGALPGTPAGSQTGTGEA